MTLAGFLPHWPPPINGFIVFGLLLLAGLCGGRLAATTRVLPAITGYIATGFLLGPGGLGWLDEPLLAQARVIAEFSLGLIVFDLGRRLDLGWARHDRWLLPMGLAESVVSFAAMFALLHLVGGIDTLEAAVAATIGIAVLLPFIEARAEGASWNPVARSLWIVAGSFLLGYVAFRVLGLLARWVGKSPGPQFILTVGAIIVTVGAAQAGRLSVLLALLVLGACARNLDREHRLIDVDFGRAAQLFFVFLFVLAGAALRFDQFGSIAWLGLAFVVARAIGKAVGLFALSWPAHISPRQAATLGLALTPMLGLSIGMTQPIYDVAPEFGARLTAVVASGVAILYLLGPIATRYALLRAGEGEPAARD